MQDKNPEVKAALTIKVNPMTGQFQSDIEIPVGWPIEEIIYWMNQILEQYGDKDNKSKISINEMDMH